MVLLAAVAVTASVFDTVTVAVVVPEQPLLSPVMVYTVVAAGEASTVLLLAALSDADGDHV